MREAHAITRIFADAVPLGTKEWAIYGADCCRVSTGRSLLLIRGPVAFDLPEEVLVRNAALPDATRIVLLPSGFELRSEVVWNEDEDRETQVLRARQQFEAARHGLAWNEMARRRIGESDTAIDPVWQGRQAAPGPWMVSLPGRQGSFTAEWNGEAAQVNILDSRRLEGDCSAAVAEVLLRTTAAIQQVRACARPDSGSWTVWMETHEMEGDQALSSLHWVVKECGCEVQALASSSSLALRYREICSMVSADQQRIDTTELVNVGTR
jgi:hypothetical protein